MYLYTVGHENVLTESKIYTISHSKNIYILIVHFYFIAVFIILIFILLKKL